MTQDELVAVCRLLKALRAYRDAQALPIRAHGFEALEREHVKVQRAKDDAAAALDTAIADVEAIAFPVATAAV